MSSTATCDTFNQRSIDLGLERQFVNELLHDSFLHDVNDIYGSILT